MSTDAKLIDKQTGAAKRTVEKIQLPSRTTTAPSGVGMMVTACPHRNGNPDQEFYEVWFNWEGGTLRSSTIIHDDDAREIILSFLYELTAIEQDDTVDEILNKYDWR